MCVKSFMDLPLFQCFNQLTDLRSEKKLFIDQHCRTVTAKRQNLSNPMH